MVQYCKIPRIISFIYYRNHQSIDFEKMIDQIISIAAEKFVVQQRGFRFSELVFVFHRNPSFNHYITSQNMNYSQDSFHSTSKKKCDCGLIQIIQWNLGFGKIIRRENSLMEKNCSRALILCPICDGGPFFLKKNGYANQRFPEYWK